LHTDIVTSAFVQFRWMLAHDERLPSRHAIRHHSIVDLLGARARPDVRFADLI